MIIQIKVELANVVDQNTIATWLSGSSIFNNPGLHIIVPSS